MKMRHLLLIFIAVFIVDVAFGQGCSQCKLLAEQASDADEGSFGSNINTGILYLMAIPYLLLLFLFRKKLKSAFRFVFGKRPSAS